jgi:hypothetical protein
MGERGEDILGKREEVGEEDVERSVGVRRADGTADRKGIERVRWREFRQGRRENVSRSNG